ncbi:Methyl-accepting chemotaxis protein PctA [compost metagenome]
MRDRSLHVKLFYTSLVGTVAVLALLLSFIAYIAFEFSVEKNAQLVDSVVIANAKEVETQLGAGWAVAESIASSAIAMKEQHLDRTTADAITRKIFEANPQLFGLGHYWEANAFDNKDSEFVNRPNNDSSGRYVVYWNRTGGVIKSEALVGYATETSDNQYYFRPMHTLQSWASEPFAYSTADRQHKMMVSLMVPLLRAGKALGVAGVDISLEAINQRLSKVDIFKGYGALVSTDGLYASHPDKDHWGRLNDDLPASAVQAVKAGLPYNFFRNGWNYVLQPVHIGNAPNPWSLLVAYPQAEAMAEIHHFVFTSVIVGCLGLIVLAGALWYLLGWHIRPLSALTLGIQGWQGELGLSFEQCSADETGKLASAFNQFIERLRRLVGSIRQSSSALAKISDHLGDASQAVAERATAQHMATEEMASGVTALACSVTEVSQQAEDVENLARNTERLTTKISSDMNEALAGITHIDQTMAMVADAVGDLEKRSQQIAGIIAVIRSIADQTNLLALNAAIEAARAGEQGRGFAVVADEVRQLAERTSRSTGEIGVMIGAIGGDVRNTVTNVNLVGEAVSRGVTQLTESANGVHQIRHHAQDILKRISGVARQTQSQAATGEQLSVAIQEVSRISEQNDTAIQSLLEQSVKLREHSKSLSQQLSEFRD